MTHPTIAMLKLIDEADVGVVDDRFINQHVSMKSETTSRPLITTLDLAECTEGSRKNVSCPKPSSY